MKSVIKELIRHESFKEVYTRLYNCILSNGFIVIHEIDTQQILQKQGFQISPLRQLLFFHPNYMKVILDNDPLAVNAVPLKFVIREIEPNKTSVSFADPVVNFSGYELPDALANELREKINRMVE